MKKRKYKNRYIVGTGYPVWIDSNGVQPRGIALYPRNFLFPKYLIIPEDLKNPPRPKFRLVLEKIISKKEKP